MKTYRSVVCAIAVAATLLPPVAQARGYHQYGRSYRRSPIHVRSYIRRDGRFVLPFVRTAPNHSKLDNWSTRGNVNPYTGRAGTKAPY